MHYYAYYPQEVGFLYVFMAVMLTTSVFTKELDHSFPFIIMGVQFVPLFRYEIFRLFYNVDHIEILNHFRMCIRVFTAVN